MERSTPRLPSSHGAKPAPRVLPRSSTPSRGLGVEHTVHAATDTGGATAKVRRLVADERYFGVEGRALRAGLENVLARLSAQPDDAPHIDIDTLSKVFQLSGVASLALLRGLVAAGLLQAGAAGRYRPTALFRDYAAARVIAPLSRARARLLLERAREVAGEINARWSRNPYRVKIVAVSGSYMSRRRHMPELSLWVVVQRRPFVRARKWKPVLGKADALRQIVREICALSSFITVRVVADRDAVARPFSVVFQSGDEVIGDSMPTWERFRDWGASISRRLIAK